MIDNSDYTSPVINVINKLQITLRERNLAFDEKKELYSIIDNTKDDLIKVGSLLLLGEQEEVEKILKKIDVENLKRLKEFLIYKF